MGSPSNHLNGPVSFDTFLAKLGIIKPSNPCGPVAQLGARFNGIEEVAGSTPARSTIFFQTGWHWLDIAPLPITAVTPIAASAIADSWKTCSAWNRANFNA